MKYLILHSTEWSHMQVLNNTRVRDLSNEIDLHNISITLKHTLSFKHI